VYVVDARRKARGGNSGVSISLTAGEIGALPRKSVLFRMHRMQSRDMLAIDADTDVRDKERSRHGR
jgi:hypothetical protein